MSNSQSDAKLDRRGFLRAGLGSATVAAGAAGTTTAVQAAENDADKKKARYKETDHVKAYYRTNRY